MTDQGQRPVLVIVESFEATSDDYGGEVRTWAERTRGWARIRYGTSQERREAAQENAGLTATFEFDWSSALAATTPTDRLRAQGRLWDVYSAVVIRQNTEVHVTATVNLSEPVEA